MGRLGRLLGAALLSLASSACGSSDASGLFTAYDGGRDPSPEAGVGGQGGQPSQDAGGCPEVTLVSPLRDAVLSEADDSDGMCAPNVETDVVAASNAADGTVLELWVSQQRVAVSPVQGAVVRFQGVSLSPGAHTLAVVEPFTACGDALNVTVSCSGVPSCTISEPTFSASRPHLNGEAVPLGDRTGPEAAPFQTAFTVNTTAPDGQLVTLQVDGVADSAVASVLGGVASFPTVTLAPDGLHNAVAWCHAPGEQVTRSSLLQLSVDTQPPELTVVSPLEGEHFGPANDADPSTVGVTEIDVCMTTQSTDAVNLSPLLAQGSSNFCVAVGTLEPECVPALSSAGDNGCVRVECPHSTPFDVTLTLRDRAGNLSEQVVQDLTCASSKPQVQIVSPSSTIAGQQATRLLAANSGQLRRDQDGLLPGAQWTVRACTDAAVGSAVLQAGVGGALTEIAGPVTLQTAVAGDACPLSLPRVARFTDATLPESGELLDGSLDTATSLRVQVTDLTSEVGLSNTVNIWVDSQPPTLSVFSATRCGDLVRSGNATEAVDFQFASAYPVDVQLLRPTLAPLYQTFAFQGGGLTESLPLDLEQGDNPLSASNVEPSGNFGALPGGCVIQVGDPPIVEWQDPVDDAQFNMASDGDPLVPGWQGDLTVQVSNIDLMAEAPPVTVTFFRNGLQLGSPQGVDTGTGLATLAAVTLGDGSGTLQAVTGDTSKGIGSAYLRQSGSTQVLVDTLAPAAPTLASLSVLDRRQTSLRFAWTAPSDNGQPVAGYQVRVDDAPIDAANFDDPQVGKVTFVGSPGTPGTTNVGVTISNRLIERDYYTAVVATDAAGNRSDVVSVGPVAAHFNVSVLSAQLGGEGLGMAIDGSTSLNGDGGSDLVVGSQYGNRVYVWFAAAGGAAYSGSPGLTITGPSNVGFGNYVVCPGDLNDDGREDLVVGAPFDNPTSSGRAYVFFQPQNGWPASLNAAAADVTVIGDQNVSSFDFAFTGGSLSRVGDFDGDGVDDVAIGLPFWGPDGLTGYVAVLRGRTTLSGTVTLPGAVGTTISKSVTAILGEVGVTSGFSSPMVGLGPFYSTRGSLVASAWQGSPRRVYAFDGQIGDASGQIAAAGADNTISNDLGEFGRTLALIGRFGGNAALGIGLPKFIAGGGGQGQAQLYFGNAANGPFVNVATIEHAGTLTGDQFATVIVGSAIAGSTLQGSFLGGSSADVVLAGSRQQGLAPTLYFLEGQSAQSLVGQTVDVTDVADAVLDLSLLGSLSGWVGTASPGSAIFDMNGDGAMDLALGEHDASFTTGFDGRVVIIW